MKVLKSYKLQGERVNLFSTAKYAEEAIKTLEGIINIPVYVDKMIIDDDPEEDYKYECIYLEDIRKRFYKVSVFLRPKYVKVRIMTQV